MIRGCSFDPESTQHPVTEAVWERKGLGDCSDPALHLLTHLTGEGERDGVRHTFLKDR